MADRKPERGGGGSGGRSARVSAVRNSEGTVLGYQTGGRAFSTKREATAAARTARIRSIPGSQFMTAGEIRTAIAGTRIAGMGRAGAARRKRGGSFAASVGSGAERFRRAEQRETFRHRVR